MTGRWDDKKTRRHKKTKRQKEDGDIRDNKCDNCGTMTTPTITKTMVITLKMMKIVVVRQYSFFKNSSLQPWLSLINITSSSYCCSWYTIMANTAVKQHKRDVNAAKKWFVPRLSSGASFKLLVHFHRYATLRTFCRGWILFLSPVAAFYFFRPFFL